VDDFLLTIAKKLRPELENSSRLEQVAGAADVFGILYSAPLVLLGLMWLAVLTDLSQLANDWTILILLAFLVFLFDRLRFFILMDIKGLLIGAEGSLSSVAVWAGALLFGPSGLWLGALGVFGEFVRSWRQKPSPEGHWGRLRSSSLRLAGGIAAGLMALALYERWGGVFPIPDLSLDSVLPALASALVWAMLALLFYAPFILYMGSRAARLTEGAASLWSFMQAAFVGVALPALAAPFGILAAGLYSQNGLALFLFFVGGLLLGSYMAHQLSQAVERSQQRSREMENLEQLGHATMKAPPDASTLPELLQQHVPGMFPSSEIEIRRFPNQTLMRFPDSDSRRTVPTLAWDWLRKAPQARYIQPGSVPPWDSRPIREPLVLAPVIDTETTKPIGGVCVMPRRSAIDAASLLPAVQSLAAQISSTLQSARVYERTLEHQKVEHELALAGEIQASFLPDALPEVPGWQLAVTLEPARQTSGDFYDVIPLPNRRLGLLIADVADKGTGAALYMALSRTLIRTYAVEHHTRPDFALRVANNRILTDAQADLFVTAFYGVLDPLTGTLTYCNAGHNPPLLLKTSNMGEVETLTRTGLPLGLFHGESWTQKTIQLDVGDVLVLYTDGVTEAQDRREEFFGTERLLATMHAHRERSAQEIQSALIEEIHAFVGGAPRFDDIALMVLVREA
jgi:serine phosphatase RsbU (regulator of sigma subunit)